MRISHWFVLLCVVAFASLAAADSITIDAQPNSVLQERTFASSASRQVGELPYSGNATASDSSGQSQGNYSLSSALLSISMRHAATSSGYVGQSSGSIFLHIDQDAAYSILDQFQVSPGAPWSVTASLVDQSDATTLLSHTMGNATPGGQTSVTATGTLYAGHDYEFSYMFTSRAAATKTDPGTPPIGPLTRGSGTVLGSFEMSLNAVAAPLPTTIYGGLTLLGVLGMVQSRRDRIARA